MQYFTDTPTYFTYLEKKNSQGRPEFPKGE